MAGTDCDLNRFVDGKEAVADRAEDPHLPRVEDVFGKGRAGFAPRKGTKGEGMWVVRNRSQPLDELWVH